jgi:hypothetical protein
MRFVSDQRAGNGDGGGGGADAVEGVRGSAVVRVGIACVVVRWK